MSAVRVCYPSFHSLAMSIASCVHVLASLPLLGRPKFKTLRNDESEYILGIYGFGCIPMSHVANGTVESGL
ncbi:hypothetical protein VNO80_21369 [Phaseolus coccineus]|uniref:Uncharacterized protein n=1 Tax=Phaseolus coccineus TaxID=3886 RepID=A0AAN9M2Y8_PHACN